jgi:hypothetical protein|tara:strand:+ start:1631 stop:2161 length:531 start_codon:yes stop_codon:yes gene_type:complete
MADFEKVGSFFRNHPYAAAAGVLLGGYSFFSARKAEEARRKRLKEEMGMRIGEIQDDIPSLISEYEQQADIYRAQGNTAGQRIYENAAMQFEAGGQTNLAYGSADVRRETLGGLLGSQLQGINLTTSGRVMNTQNQLASELNKQQINIDRIRASYAKQGIPSTDVNIGDVNSLKYV